MLYPSYIHHIYNTFIIYISYIHHDCEITTHETRDPHVTPTRPHVTPPRPHVTANQSSRTAAADFAGACRDAHTRTGTLNCTVTVYPHNSPTPLPQHNVSSQIRRQQAGLGEGHHLAQDHRQDRRRALVLQEAQRRGPQTAAGAAAAARCSRLFPLPLRP